MSKSRQLDIYRRSRLGFGKLPRHLVTKLSIPVETSRLNWREVLNKLLRLGNNLVKALTGIDVLIPGSWLSIPNISWVLILICLNCVDFHACLLIRLIDPEFSLNDHCAISVMETLFNCRLVNERTKKNWKAEKTIVSPF